MAKAMKKMNSMKAMAMTMKAKANSMKAMAKAMKKMNSMKAMAMTMKAKANSMKAMAMTMKAMTGKRQKSMKAVAKTMKAKAKVDKGKMAKTMKTKAKAMKSKPRKAMKEMKAMKFQPVHKYCEVFVKKSPHANVFIGPSGGRWELFSASYSDGVLSEKYIKF
jgi:hypothetical protein